LTGCCGEKQDHKRGELEHDVITILSKDILPGISMNTEIR
jgi:hypothetical protein